MGSLAEIRADRLRVLKDLRRAEKELDTRLEVLERLLKRLIERKLKLPQMEDLAKILDLVKEVDQQMSVLSKAATNAVIGFRF